MKNLVLLIGLLFLSLIAGFLGAWIWNELRPPQDMIKEFYSTENAVGVSPSDYLQGKVDGTLVDLRDNNSYNAGHLEGAINIPVGQMSYIQVLTAFKQLPQNKPIVVYCYSSYCMLSIEVGNFLAENGIYVKHLNLGAMEVNSDFPTYIVNGTNPGVLSVNPNQSTGCPATGGGFGC